MCKIALGVNPWVAPYVSRNLPEPEYIDLLVFAATRNGTMIRQFADQYLPHVVYVAAIKQNNWAIRHVPYKKVTLDLCAIAGRKNNGAYTYYCDPHNGWLRSTKSAGCYVILTRSIGLIACRLNPSALQFVDIREQINVMRSLVAERLLPLWPLRLAASLLVEVSLSLGAPLLRFARGDATSMDYGLWWPMCVAIKRRV